MNNYELTERGKIVIAVVVAILLFVITAAILWFLAWNSSAQTPNDPPQSQAPVQDDPPPVISETPLPEGSGFDPAPEDPPNQEPPQSDDGEQGSFDPPDAQPEIGPISLNLYDGTMLFRFSPDSQDALDAGTASMLEDFMGSPRNTAQSQIVVEIPDLSEEDTSILKSAIADAFSAHGIAQRSLSYVTRESDTDERVFEVKLSFLLTGPPSAK